MYYSLQLYKHNFHVYPTHPLHKHKHKQTAPSASPTGINTILNALLILIEPHHNSVCRFFIFPKTKSFPKASCKTANAGEKIYTFLHYRELSSAKENCRYPARQHRQVTPTNAYSIMEQVGKEVRTAVNRSEPSILASSSKSNVLETYRDHPPVMHALKSTPEV